VIGAACATGCRPTPIWLSDQPAGGSENIHLLMSGVEAVIR
jgi:hypothetical protein